MRYFTPALAILITIPLLVLATEQNAPDQSGSRTDQLLNDLYVSQSTEVFVVAHRGIWRDFPENSIAAIKRADTLGVHMVELDIRQTKDGHLILMHDKTLDRTTTGSGDVNKHTLEEIKSLHLLNGYGVPTEERVPTLAEALQATSGRMLVYLDKSYELISEAFDIALSLGVQEQVFFYGYATADQLKWDYPKLHENLNYLPKLKPNIENRKAYIDGFLKRERSPAFVVSFEDDDPSFFQELERIRTAGKRVWASPLWPGMCGDRTDDRAMKDADANWGWLIDQGFSMICTDRPRELLQYLSSRERTDKQATVPIEQ